MPPSSPEEQAIGVTCDRVLHRVLWVPETADHAKLRVTYSTTTNFNNNDLPVILFMGPMFGTRWASLLFDKLAGEEHVRVICVDRPGFGGSTEVDISLRIRVWLETVPILLQQLDVKHVALLSHSAGTLYCLNSFSLLRHMLGRQAYVAFLAPYVPMAHSGATLPTMAAKLPNVLLDSWSGLNTFINGKVMPTAAWSGGIAPSITTLLSPSASTDVPGVDTSLEPFGCDKDTAKLIKKFLMKYQVAETNTGANSELKLCLRRGASAADWGEAADYPKCVQKIADNETVFNNREANAAKVTVEAFFAESDVMSGKRGQKYFEDCWQSEGVRGKIDFATHTLPGSDHDSVLIDQENGALRAVFQKVAQLARSGE